MTGNDRPPPPVRNLHWTGPPEPMLDDDGQPILDPRTGFPMYQRAAAWEVVEDFPDPDPYEATT